MRDFIFEAAFCLKRVDKEGKFSSRHVVILNCGSDVTEQATSHPAICIVKING